MLKCILLIVQVLKGYVQLYCLDSNGKQLRYSRIVLIPLDLDLTQYLHGVLEEQKYTRRLIKKKVTFKIIKTRKKTFK